MKIRQESPTTLIQTLYILSPLFSAYLEITDYESRQHNTSKMSRIFMYVHTPHKGEHL